MQRLLNASPWDDAGVRADLRTVITEAIGDKEHAILVVDETGFLKKGKKSAGVAKMYTGTAGKTEKCQIGVVLTYTSPAGHALIDGELYLPATWTNDPDRCAAAGIPDDVEFATKYELAQRMSGRARAAGTPFAWVTADEVYGQAQPLRDYLERERISYVMAVRRTEKVALTTGNTTAEAVIAGPETAWQRMSAGDGTKAPRLSDWATIDMPATIIRKATDTSSRGKVSTTPATSHTTSATPINRKPWKNSSSSQPVARPSRSASKPARTKQASTTTKSATTPRGMDT